MTPTTPEAPLEVTPEDEDAAIVAAVRSGNSLLAEDIADLKEHRELSLRPNEDAIKAVEDAARHRLAQPSITPAAGGNEPPVSPGDRWIERWCGSGMWRGSSIWTADALGCHKNMIEHVGGDEETHASVRRIVAAHNAALTATEAYASEASAFHTSAPGFLLTAAEGLRGMARETTNA